MSVQAIPKGYEGIIPSAPIRDARRALEFMQKVLGAEVLVRMDAKDGGIAHCEVGLHGGRLMFGEASPENPAHPFRICLYVQNVDEVFARALAAGATVKQPLTNQFYGDRTGRLLDPSGNEWILATHVEEVSEAEMMRRMKALEG